MMPSATMYLFDLAMTGKTQNITHHKQFGGPYVGQVLTKVMVEGDPSYMAMFLNYYTDPEVVVLKRDTLTLFDANLNKG